MRNLIFHFSSAVDFKFKHFELKVALGHIHYE